MSFRMDSGALVSNIRQVPERIQHIATGLTDFHGTRGENAMRKNASWKDRTTNARNGLHVTVTHSPEQHVLTFAHGVAYGIWLEVRWAGRYQIIMPSVLSEGRALMKSFDKAMGKM